jgi:hypothetical protein
VTARFAAAEHLREPQHRHLHALSSYRGSGVHHIAFDCDDIFEVSRAKEAGVPLLDIPLNYYDDLAARFDFDDEFLSELAYYNVLYDRDAQGGELFHVYTEPFEGRSSSRSSSARTAMPVTARPTSRYVWRRWPNRAAARCARRSCRKFVTRIKQRGFLHCAARPIIARLCSDGREPAMTMTSELPAPSIRHRAAQESQEQPGKDPREHSSGSHRRVRPAGLVRRSRGCDRRAHPHLQAHDLLLLRQ